MRRELADNFCFYNASYDTLAGAAVWARETLEGGACVRSSRAVHRPDPRPVLYTLAQLEAGQTTDLLWNAAQLQMVQEGKMHGCERVPWFDIRFLRMYWAKKILEWSESAEVALRHVCAARHRSRQAIYLNDRYQLDGRDPNGYVGMLLCCFLLPSFPSLPSSPLDQHIQAIRSTMSAKDKVACGASAVCTTWAGPSVLFLERSGT